MKGREKNKLLPISRGGKAERRFPEFERVRRGGVEEKDRRNGSLLTLILPPERARENKKKRRKKKTENKTHGGAPHFVSALSLCSFRPCFLPEGNPPMSGGVVCTCFPGSPSFWRPLGHSLFCHTVVCNVRIAYRHPSWMPFGSGQQKRQLPRNRQTRSRT